MYAAILAGGSGTRFWPLSRTARPKQFLDLLGGGSLLEATAARLPPLVRPSETLVVCGPVHAEEAQALHGGYGDHRREEHAAVASPGKEMLLLCVEVLRGVVRHDGYWPSRPARPARRPASTSWARSTGLRR